MCSYVLAYQYKCCELKWGIMYSKYNWPEKNKVKKVLCKNYYKGHMDKIKGEGGGGGGWRRGREVGSAGVGWRDGLKMQTTVIE